MAIVRRITNRELQEAIRLSDETFRDAEQPSMGDAFPFIFSEAEDHHSYGAFQEDGKLLAFMGLVPWVLRVGDARLQVFSLGSVCTASEARGQGIASEILEEIYRHIRQAGASLLLVSGGRSLYTRTGCMPFGRVRRYGIDRTAAEAIAAAPGGDAAQLREMAPADLFTLHQVASIRDVAYDFSVRELSALIKAEAFASCVKKNHRVLVAESNGEVAAFAVVGVPRDPQKRGQVIEQAGNPAIVARLAAEAVIRYRMTELDFHVPWHERELDDRLSGFGLPAQEGPSSGTIKVVDGDALLDQLRPWLDRRQAGSAQSLRLSRSDDGSWLLGRENDSPVALTDAELVRLIFDCVDADGGMLSWPKGAESFRGLFPAPLPYPVGLGYI